MRAEADEATASRSPLAGILPASNWTTLTSWRSKSLTPTSQTSCSVPPTRSLVCHIGRLSTAATFGRSASPSSSSALTSAAAGGGSEPLPENQRFWGERRM